MTDRPDAMPDAAPASWWEDYLEIFFAPSRVFARRAKASFWMPFLVLSVISIALMLGLKGSFQPAMEADMARGMVAAQEKNPELTAEQLEQGMAIQQKVGGVVLLVIIPITVFIIGLMLWLFGKLVGATETLGQATLIAAFASFPRIVGLLAGGIQGILLPPESLNGMSRLSIGPARFLDPDTASAMTVALAARFDLTLIWITLLLAIGLKVIGNIPMTKALIAAGLVWFVGALPGLAGTLAGGG